MSTRKITNLAAAGAVAALAASSNLSARDSTGLVDTLAFGDAASEQSHEVVPDHSGLITGGLGEPARRLLPLTPESWQGGRIAFTLAADSGRAVVWKVIWRNAPAANSA